MITEMIDNHIQTLGEAMKKGLTPYKMESTEGSCRKLVTSVNRKMNLSEASWNKLLSSIILIEMVNRSRFSDEILNDLLSTRHPVSELEAILLLPFNESIHHKLTSMFHSTNKKLTFSDFLVDTLSYIKTYGIGDVDLQEILKGISIFSTSGYTEDYYSPLPLRERVRMLRASVSHYIREGLEAGAKRFIAFKSSLPYLELFEELWVAYGNDLIEEIYPCLLSTLTRSGDSASLVRSILIVIKEVDEETVCKWLRQLFGNKDNLVMDSEILKLIYNIESRCSDDVYAHIYGKSSLAYQALNASEMYGAHHVAHIKQCIVSAKKGFLRLILNDEGLNHFLRLGNRNLLFRVVFQSIVNLNTLNVKNLESLYSKEGDDEKLNRFDKQLTLTFDEFSLLYEKPQKDISFYQTMIPILSIGDRLRIARELPELDSVQLLFTTEEDLFATLLNLVSVMPMKQWVSKKGWKLIEAEDRHYLMMLLVPEYFEKFQEEIQKGSDVDFIVKERNLLTLADSLDEAKLMFVEKDGDCQYLLNSIEVSHDFVQRYKTNIVSFYERGLCEVFKMLHNSNKLDQRQICNLKLITKAELTGKLRDIKFAKEDFELEIGLPISSNVMMEWINNTEVQAGVLRYIETYDYETTLRIGQYPEETCQSWNGGSYSQCLLSNFDTNKKLLVVKGRKGNIVARAIIRLTKGADKYIPKPAPVKPQRLGFIDVESKKETITILEIQPPKEELILFLERCYTSMDGKHAREARRQLVKLALEKSYALGAKLVLADEYENDNLEELKNYHKKNYYVFISYSKNGSQYLDSLSGQATEENEGEYKKGTLLVSCEQI